MISGTLSSADFMHIEISAQLELYRNHTTVHTLNTHNSLHPEQLKIYSRNNSHEEWKGIKLTARGRCHQRRSGGRCTDYNVQSKDISVTIGYVVSFHYY